MDRMDDPAAIEAPAADVPEVHVLVGEARAGRGRVVIVRAGRALMGIALAGIAPAGRARGGRARAAIDRPVLRLPRATDPMQGRVEGTGSPEVAAGSAGDRVRVRWRASRGAMTAAVRAARGARHTGNHVNSGSREVPTTSRGAALRTTRALTRIDDPTAPGIPARRSGTDRDRTGP